MKSSRERADLHRRALDHAARPALPPSAITAALIRYMALPAQSGEAARPPRRGQPACRASCRPRAPRSGRRRAPAPRDRGATTLSAFSSASASAMSRGSNAGRPRARPWPLPRRAGRDRLERHAGGRRASRAATRFCEASTSLIRRPLASPSRSPHQLDDRRRGFLDRAAGDVDHRPAIVGEHPPREGELGIDRLLST